MALASGETNYMAPASARQMASDLALLPMWYADAGSAVLAPSAYNADFLKTKSELLSMDVALLTEPEVADGKDRKFSPWGLGPCFAEAFDDIGSRSGGATFCGLYEYSERTLTSSAGGKVVAGVAVE